MADEFFVQIACENHFLVGYCLRFHVATRFRVQFLIIFEAIFSKIEILQPRYAQMESA
ncbi:MAG: hypothetical protein ACI9T7_001211 [Oleiphilaceae bacterium]|jgi:hypothetical protein